MMAKPGVDSPQPNRIPISVVTGYLGSGKTTLINHLVRQPGMQATALIINEFGEIGLDHVLVESSFENTLLLENGCICCSIRGDLIDTISDLFAKVGNGQLPPFTRIVIETTGLANPAPIVHAILTNDAVINRCALETVVTLVDGVQGRVHIERHEEAVTQISQADLALVSKVDLCSEDDIAGITNAVLNINPSLDIAAIEHGQIDPDALFLKSGRHGRDHTHHVHHDEDHDGHDHFQDHRHGDISTWSLVHGAPLDEARLRAWLSMIYSLRPYAMLRLKGYLRLAGYERPLLVQAVGSIISSPEWLDAWPEGKEETRLVLIFKGMTAAAVQTSFRAHVLNASAN
jgi:G3E family GTPase